MDTITANGAAVSRGIRITSKGTAINASPKPRAERTNVAKNITPKTYNVIPPSLPNNSAMLYLTGLEPGSQCKRLAPTTVYPELFSQPQSINTRPNECGSP